MKKNLWLLLLLGVCGYSHSGFSAESKAKLLGDIRSAIDSSGDASLQEIRGPLEALSVEELEKMKKGWRANFWRADYFTPDVRARILKAAERQGYVPPEPAPPPAQFKSVYDDDDGAADKNPLAILNTYDVLAGLPITILEGGKEISATVRIEPESIGLPPGQSLDLLNPSTAQAIYNYAHDAKPRNVQRSFYSFAVPLSIVVPGGATRQIKVDHNKLLSMLTAVREKRGVEVVDPTYELENRALRRPVEAVAYDSGRGELKLGVKISEDLPMHWFQAGNERELLQLKEPEESRQKKFQKEVQDHYDQIFKSGKSAEQALLSALAFASKLGRDHLLAVDQVWQRLEPVVKERIEARKDSKSDKLPEILEEIMGRLPGSYNFRAPQAAWLRDLTKRAAAVAETPEDYRQIAEIERHIQPNEKPDGYATNWADYARRFRLSDQDAILQMANQMFENMDKVRPYLNSNSSSDRAARLARLVGLSSEAVALAMQKPNPAIEAMVERVLGKLDREDKSHKPLAASLRQLQNERKRQDRATKRAGRLAELKKILDNPRTSAAKRIITQCKAVLIATLP